MGKRYLADVLETLVPPDQKQTVCVLTDMDKYGRACRWPQVCGRSVYTPYQPLSDY